MKKYNRRIWERRLGKHFDAAPKEEERPVLEHCVCCGKRTDVPISTPITDRACYVSGVGQLCEPCYFEINCPVTQAKLERQQKEMKLLVELCRSQGDG